jgi:hypothetical protein
MYIIPHLYVLKKKNEVLKFWIFKCTLEFHTFLIVIFFNVSNKLLSFHIFYHQLISIIWVLWKSFVEITFFNNIKSHFQKSLIKPKLKIGSNGFFIWVS